MDYHWDARLKAYRKAISMISSYLPALPSSLTLVLVIDSMAGWASNDSRQGRRAIVRIPCRQAAPQEWEMVRDSEEIGLSFRK